MGIIRFDFYPGFIKNTIRTGTVTLEQFIKGNRSPKDNIKKVFKEIEKATSIGDLKTKNELKQKNLVFFTPSVETDGKGRSYTNIVKFNPLIVLDFDGLTKKEAIDLRYHLFNDFKSCICSWISPSGHGTKAIFKLNSAPMDVEEFKAFGAGLGHTFEWYKGFDSSSISNPILPLFLSWDEEMLIRPFEEAVGWNLKGYRKTLFEPFTGEIPSSDSFTQDQIDKVVNTVKFYINRIVDNAYPQCRSSALLAGSFSAYYGIDLLAVLEQAIEENDYMSKDTSTYLKTAREMFHEGLNNPQKLK